ncbi:MAG: pirin family protein [Firmicutes bacterium]|nr:pirin family protein [Bacillota bacterium]
MLIKLDHNKMGRSNLGWLNSLFHFSFAEYFNRYNMNFGVLRVLNDDVIRPHTGFDTHPHKDMEIVTYIIEGELTHADSMNNERTLSRGEVQYMSAGTGVYHSEKNQGEVPLRLLQLWIVPDGRGYLPNYGDHSFPWNDRVNQWLHLVSNIEGTTPITIHQDANIYATFLEKGKNLTFPVQKGRQAYLVQIEGNSFVNEVELIERDAIQILEESIELKAITDSHYLLVEMKKK